MISWLYFCDKGIESPEEKGFLNVTLAREINPEESGRFPPASLLSFDDIEKREEPSSWIYDTQVDEELVLSLSQHTPTVFSQTLSEFLFIQLIISRE